MLIASGGGRQAARPAPTRSKHQGDFRKIVQGVNDTLDAVIGPLNVAAEYVDRISKGDIPAKITDSYNGDFNEIKNNLNRASTRSTAGGGRGAGEAAVEGKLATRADATKHQGDFREDRAGRQRHAGRRDRPAERGGRVRRPDLQGRHPGEDHRQLQRRLQRDQEQPQHLHRRGERAGGRCGDAVSRAAVEGKLATPGRRHQAPGRLPQDRAGRERHARRGDRPAERGGEYVDRISKGDIPAKITDNYNGDFNEIKNNLNRASTR